MFVRRGVLALMIAAPAFLTPAELFLALTLVFGAFSFAAGVFGPVADVCNIRKAERSGWLMSSGILGFGNRHGRGRGRLALRCDAGARDIPLGQHHLLVCVFRRPGNRGSDAPAINQG
ncbi:DUF308 domain-containing protein [Pseudorhodoplanes sp.]|uniref:DUF308 domain-containing protein n=1 Tax=Pseudorhodoplanes sp. TaxID=1934341 RepID=UPI0039198BC8